MKKDNFWGDFFFMDKLITPHIIKIVNMIFIVLLALGCLIALIVSVVAAGFAGIFTFLGVVIGAAISYIIFRIFLEISLILFKIEENTRNKKK